jgi:hypothetical protein
VHQWRAMDPCRCTGRKMCPGEREMHFRVRKGWSWSQSSSDRSLAVCGVVFLSGIRSVAVVAPGPLGALEDTG